MRTCRINTCCSIVHSRGLCSRCYKRLLYNGTLKKVPVRLCRICRKKHRAKGYCKQCYYKWIRLGRPKEWDGNYTPVKTNTCSHEGCKKEGSIRGMCCKHAIEAIGGD